MRIDTPVRQAFESVTSGLEGIERFRATHDYSALEEADAALTTAVNADPEYVTAVYYLGVVKDLAGKPVEAPPLFEKIVKSVADPGIRDEARYNLGVAYYHQYHKPELRQAKGCFKKVSDSARDEGLRYLARATLAQAHAMSMHPSTKEREILDKELTGADQLRNEIRTEFDAARATANAVLEGVKARRRGIGRDQRRTIEATAHNALGMAHMYVIDWLTTDEPTTRQHLDEARQHLTRAAGDLADDWANTCDLASCHLRFAVHASSPSAREVELNEAERLLNAVLRNLRPGYGFAHYELGRVYRISSRFAEAIEEFDRALSVPERYRDVSENKVKAERQRSENRETQFP